MGFFGGIVVALGRGRIFDWVAMSALLVLPAGGGIVFGDTGLEISPPEDVVASVECILLKVRQRAWSEP